MTKRESDIELATWLIGTAMSAIGGAFMWGWPAAFLIVGGMLMVWPLVKEVARR